jgi:hypothetical protein
LNRWVAEFNENARLLHGYPFAIDKAHYSRAMGALMKMRDLKQPVSLVITGHVGQFCLLPSQNRPARFVPAGRHEELNCSPNPKQALAQGLVHAEHAAQLIQRMVPMARIQTESFGLDRPRQAYPATLPSSAEALKQWQAAAAVNNRVELRLAGSP